MPIRTFWDDENKTVIRVVFEEKWGLDDFDGMVNDIRQMRAGARYRIDVLLDFTTSFSGYSLNLLPIITRIERIIANHTGITVLVKGPPYVKYLVGVVDKIAPRITQDLYLVDSLADAYELLEKKPPAPSD